MLLLNAKYSYGVQTYFRSSTGALIRRSVPVKSSNAVVDPQGRGTRSAFSARARSLETSPTRALREQSIARNPISLFPRRLRSRIASCRMSELPTAARRND